MSDVEKDQHILGFDIGGTKVGVILAHPRGEVVSRRRFKTRAAEGFDATFERICRRGNEVLEEARKNGMSIGRIGVSIGGPLDVDTGTILSPPNLPGWDSIPLRDLLEKQFGLPVTVEHDGLAGALAEHRYGAAIGLKHVVFLTLGTGLGAGFILNGAPYRGANGSAGNIGHIRMEHDGPNIWGKPGCWESFTSGAGVAALARWRHPHHFAIGVTAKDVAELARRGDEVAIEVLHTSGKYLGKGLAMLMDTFSPEMIVLGSLGVRLGEFLLDSALAVVEEEALPTTRALCRVVPSQLGESLGDLAPIAAVVARGQALA